MVHAFKEVNMSIVFIRYAGSYDNEDNRHGPYIIWICCRIYQVFVHTLIIALLSFSANRQPYFVTVGFDLGPLYYVVLEILCMKIMDMNLV